MLLATVCCCGLRLPERAVSAAGAKAILDLPKTLEVLETQGVPVIAYGQDDFPAFWSRDSGLKSPLMLNSPAAIANFQKMRDLLGVDGGMLIATAAGGTGAIFFTLAGIATVTKKDFSFLGKFLFVGF